VEALRSAAPAPGDLEPNAMPFAPAHMRQYLFAFLIRGVDQSHGQVSIADTHESVLAIYCRKHPQEIQNRTIWFDHRHL